MQKSPIGVWITKGPVVSLDSSLFHYRRFGKNRKQSAIVSRLLERSVVLDQLPCQHITTLHLPRGGRDLARLRLLIITG